MYKEEVNTIQKYIRSRHPLFFINYADFFAVDDILRELKKQKAFSSCRFYEYVNSFGQIDFDDKHPLDDVPCDLETFLRHRYEAGFDTSQFLILKDIGTSFENASVISYLKRIAEQSIRVQDYSTVIFIVESRSLPYPRELESLLTFIDINPLSDDDIAHVINDFFDGNPGIKTTVRGNPQLLKEFVYSFKGLQKYQIEQILYTAATEGKGEISKDQQKLIVQEKKQLIKKSGILEIINQPGDFADIGGLETLKDWLKNKAVVFQNLEKAHEHGVSTPKGILIAGMPGCGKSLTAKATAALFNVPLVRLDIGSLLGKYVGESEGNMKKALALSESFSPCVLWIDELEKAFAGIGSGSASGSEVITRLFGQFLTWMQEKKSAVFIVATANSISSLPPEFLRKGRFDELFFVDLPNKKERHDIFKIKLQEKKNLNDGISLDDLAAKSDGYNGGDIEAIVNEAIERAFIRDPGAFNKMTTKDILDVLQETKSISVTLKEKIEELRKKIKEYDLKKASKD